MIGHLYCALNLVETTKKTSQFVGAHDPPGVYFGTHPFLSFSFCSTNLLSGFEPFIFLFCEHPPIKFLAVYRVRGLL